MAGRKTCCGSRAPMGDPATCSTPMVVSLAIEAFVGVREYAAEHDAGASGCASRCQTARRGERG